MILDKTYSAPVEPPPLLAFSFGGEEFLNADRPIECAIDCDGDVTIERKPLGEHLLAAGEDGFDFMLSPDEAIALGEGLVELGRAGLKRRGGNL